MENVSGNDHCPTLIDVIAIVVLYLRYKHNMLVVDDMYSDVL